MGQLIVWIAAYFLLAAVAGWWPFDDSAVRTLSGQCSYEVGYEDGWVGKALACESTDYLAGYDEGEFDSDCHWAKCVKEDRDLFRSYHCGAWSQQQC